MLRKRLVTVLLLVIGGFMLSTAPVGAAEPGADIVVIGGPGAVSDGVVNHLRTCTDGTVTRISGADRYATAAAIADRMDPSNVVFVATGEAFPDALVAGATAASTSAPIVLTRRHVLPSVSRDAIERHHPTTVVVLGGTGAISEQVEQRLRAQVPNVTRLGGVDRYATAAAVSKWRYPDGADEVWIATGSDHLDALVAGPRAGASAAPLLLTRADRLPSATADELARLAPSRIVVVGGFGSVGTEVEATLRTIAPEVDRLSGSDRHATAELLATGTDATTIFIARDDAFPDGLTAGPLVGDHALLLAGSNALHPSTGASIAARTGRSCSGWSPPFPQVGSGRRIIYSNSDQQVWLIDEHELLVDTYLVSGRRGIPHAGTYSVFSKSVRAYAPYGGITMRHMVRFVRPNTWGNRWSYGFHSIPRYPNGRPLQTEAQLGTFRSGGCVRQADHKAAALYAWAAVGTTVIVLP